MKPTLIALALISLAGIAMTFPHLMPARAYSNSVEPVRMGTCVDHYNSLLKNAKTALTTGDRAGAADLLEQAKNMLPSCPALQNGASPQTLRL
jgi:hypothetical protein